MIAKPGSSGARGAVFIAAADWWTAGLAFLVAALLALPFLAGIVMLDEGALVHTADRIASGEVLYRDIATGVAPGAYYLQALLFRLFGRSLLVGRLFMILLFSVTVAGVYLLSRAVASRAVAAGSAFLFAALSVNFWRFPNYSPEAIAWILFSLGAMALYLRERRRRWLVVAGIGLGAAILFKQNYGVLASLGVAAGLMAGRAPLACRIKDVALTAAIAALPILFSIAAFAASGAAGDFVHDVVVIPLRLPTTLFARPFPPLVGSATLDLVEYLPFQDLAVQLMPWPYTHLALSMAMVRLLFFLPPAFLLLAVLLAMRRHSRTAPDEASHSSIGALYVATASFLFLGVFPRVDAHHLIMVLAPSFVVFAWALGRRAPVPIRFGFLGAAVAVVLVSAISQAAVVARLGEPGFLPLPRGGVWISRNEAIRIMDLIEEVRRRVPPGEPIFAAPALPMYYFLADRPNPTRFPLILPGALDEDEVIQNLAAKRVRHALASDVAFERVAFEFVAPKVWDYITRTYGPAEGMDWQSHPFPPYLLRRGAIGPSHPVAVLRGSAAGVAGDEAGPWTVLQDLMSPSMSQAPPHRVVSRHAWKDTRSDRVGWESMYLQRALVVRAPWGWGKALAAWKVPAGPGLGFEFSVALGPTSAPPPGSLGQGAIVEVWVAPAGEETRPTRAWIQWINPRRDVGERRWFRGIIDLSSFVSTSVARVILVTGPAPTQDGYDGEVAWAGLRLVRRMPALSSRGTAPSALPANPIAVDDTTARAILAFEPQDLAMFLEASRAYAGLPGAHAGLADVAESLGRLDLVLEPRARAARLDPWNAVYRVRLAEALERAGRVDDAIVEMREAAHIEAGHPNYPAALAALFQRLGRHDEARAWVDRALRLDRGHPWTLTILSALERYRGHFDAAESAARLALQRDPVNLRAWLDLAEALRGRGQIDRAKAALDEASALPLDARERAFVAQAYAAINHPVEAAAEWQRVLAAGPPGALQEEARRELQRISGRVPSRRGAGS